MARMQRSQIKLLIALFGWVICWNFLGVKSLAQTPNPSNKVLETPAATPVPPNQNLNPSSIEENLLESKIKTLESKIDKLESESTSPNIIPILLSALAGSILGAIVTVFLIKLFPTKYLFGGQNNQNQNKSGDRQTEDTNVQYLNATVTHLSSSFKNLGERVKELENQISGVQTSINNFSASQVPLSSQELTPDLLEIEDLSLGTPKLKLIDTYHEEPSLMFLKGIEVSETEESISNRQFNPNNPIVLENNRQGNYLIVKEKKADYLIPKPNLTINSDNYFSLESLFQCRNYSATYSSFKLIKPARVLGILGGLNWCLEEKGILQFYRDN
jgi:outer membrane murein-binding lipoprotein Lpp